MRSFERKTRTRDAFAAGVLLLAIGSASLAAQKGQHMNTQASRQCIGRFQMALPDAMAVSGRKQAIYRVDVNTVSLPPTGLQALQDEQLLRIGKLRPPPGAKHAVMRSFEIMPGAPAVLYFRDSSTPNLVALEAMRSVGDHVVIASRGADLNSDQRQALLKPGANEGVARLVELVLSTYSPSTARGFCVGHGAVVTPKPAVNEDATLTLAHGRSSNLNIRFETRTVSEPDTRTYSNLDEERQASAAQGLRITVLREQDRSVAGLAGREIRVAVAPAKDLPFVRFTWHFPGVPGRSDQPSINVVGMALQTEQAVLEGSWETILTSLRPVPF
jgi:hypothetical protein